MPREQTEGGDRSDNTPPRCPLLGCCAPVFYEHSSTCMSVQRWGVLGGGGAWACSL